MKRLIIVSLISILFSFTTEICGQFNPDSLKEFIGNRVGTYVKTNKAALVVGVIRKQGNETVWEKRYTYGHVRKDTNSPRPDSLTIFHIGSTTKTFTSTILSMLIQEGQPLRLEDFVENHIDTSIVNAPFFISNQGDTIKMTLLDLATHYSALPDDPIHPVNDSTTYDMMYNYLNDHRLSREPGKCYLYSNLGVSFLGVVLSNTTGKIIDTLFIQRVCNPLDMPDTRITLNAEQISRRATGYLSNGDSAGYFKSSWPAFYAAGGLYTSLMDFMKYLKFNMGLSGLGMPNVLDSAHKIRRVNNNKCSLPESKARIGLVWQMELLHPPQDTTLYFIWKDGDVPGFSSYICFANDSSKDLQTGVVMISNFNEIVDDMAKEILFYLNKDPGISSVQQISGSIPESFVLYQNYPNPFNPVTKIKFDIPSEFEGKTKNVKFVIYDGLGREVKTLINQELSPGSYETEFDGVDLPSGIYFYKLMYRNNILTKKMLLVK